jgi:hypothetical protein
MVDSRSFSYYDMIGYLDPLLSQGKERRGEPSGAMRWIDSMMVWSHTALKSEFRF